MPLRVVWPNWRTFLSVVLRAGSMHLRNSPSVCPKIAERSCCSTRSPGWASLIRISPGNLNLRGTSAGIRTRSWLLSSADLSPVGLMRIFFPTRDLSVAFPWMLSCPSFRSRRLLLSGGKPGRESRLPRFWMSSRSREAYHVIWKRWIRLSRRMRTSNGCVSVRMGISSGILTTSFRRSLPRIPS